MGPPAGPAHRRGPGRRVHGPGPPRAPAHLEVRGAEHEDEGINLVLVFPLLRASPDCVRQVDLCLRVLRFDHQFRDVRATDDGQPLFEARIAPLGDRETAPHLRWTAARDC